MSRDPSNSEWIERNLESARRRINQIEIEACRVRADLACIEVANATGIARGPIAVDTAPPVAGSAAQHSLDWQPAAELVPDGMEILVGAPPAVEEPNTPEVQEPIAAEAVPAGESWMSGLVNRSRGMYRRTTSPVMASLAAHAAIMVLAVSITVVTLERNDAGLTTTLVLGDKTAKESESFDAHQLADLGATGPGTADADLPQLESVAPMNHEPIPIEFESLVSPTPPGKMGPSISHDSDLGKLPTGEGGLAKDGQGTGAGLGSGTSGAAGKSPRGGGRAESTLFFGTEAKGNRFVFVVDNSSSMKGGRLEMAVAELVKTIEGLSPRQSFYVIFVSDKPYPMFMLNQPS